MSSSGISGPRISEKMVLAYILGRPLGYLIFSLLALIRDHIFQKVLGANPVFNKPTTNKLAAPLAAQLSTPKQNLGGGAFEPPLPTSIGILH